MDAHALPLAGAERPALVPDRVRDPEPAEVVDEARPAQRTHRRPPAAASRAPACGGEIGDRAGVAEGVRRLEVDEGRDRQERRVEALARRARPRAPARPRSPRPTSRPRRGRRGSCRPPRTGGPPARGRTAARARLRASAFAAGDAPDAVRDLDELGELRDPRRDRDLLALELARPAAPVPLLVRPAERGETSSGSPSCSASARAMAAWLGHHVVHLPVAGERELQPDAQAVQRRVAGAEHPHARRRRAHARAARGGT